MDTGLFVSCLAKAFLENAVSNMLTPLGLGWLPGGVKSYYEKRRAAGDRVADLEAVVLTPAETMRITAREALLLEVGESGVPEGKVGEFEAYMAQVPGVLGRSLRRQSDPAGRTVPVDIVLARPEDLARLLPQGMPRFRPGDAPLPGLDLRLDSLLGVGGFGEVWKAWNPRQPHKAPVAVKFCLDVAAGKTLHQEARLLDRVESEAKHPGIVPLLQTCLDADPPFLIYE